MFQTLLLELCAKKMVQMLCIHEFISSEGLIRDAAKSVMKLDIYEKERPVGIQIFGANLDSDAKNHRNCRKIESRYY